jgi:hypothetical protein
MYPFKENLNGSIFKQKDKTLDSSFVMLVPAKSTHGAIIY